MKSTTLLPILLIIILFQILPSLTQQPDDENSLYSEILRLNNTYSYSHLVSNDQIFWWSVSGSKLRCAVYGPASGYVAAGFSPTGDMIGSVAVIGLNVNYTLGVYYLSGQDPSLVYQFEQENLVFGSLTFMDGSLIMEYIWDTNAKNQYYNFSINDKVKMIWSFREGAVIDYHYENRTQSISPFNFETGEGAIPYTSPNCNNGIPSGHVFQGTCQCRGYYQPPNCVKTNLTNSHVFSNIVQMNWYVVNDVAHFDVTGDSGGWIGIGFCADARGLMEKMEPVIGWVDEETGKGIVQPKYVQSERILSDNDKLILSDVSAWIIDGQMGMHFSRKLGDGYNPLVNGNANMVAAKSSTNRPPPIQKHSTHSLNGVQINLINGTVTFPFQWKPAYTHGLLMYISWGILFPFGIVFARYSKHLKHALWFEVHRITQTTGFLIACTGTVGAMLMVDGAHFNTEYHSQLGASALAAMIYQICSALLRPHVEPKQRKTLQRHIFEWSHHLLGRMGVIAAWVNIFAGFNQLGLPQVFVYTHAGVIGFWVIISIIFEIRLMLERRRNVFKYQ